MDAWSQKIVASIEKQKKPIVVAICGAADLGKSHLSKEFVKSLRIKGTSASHLTLDSFLIERSKRLKQGKSGYQIEAYEHLSALEAISQFKQGQPIIYAPYEHDKGKQSCSLETLEPSTILFFDGVQSMHEQFLPHVDLSVFVYTGDDVLKKLRIKADLTKRNLTIETAENNSESEFLQYKKQIEPYKKHADFQLFLERKWSYTLQQVTQTDTKQLASTRSSQF